MTIETVVMFSIVALVVLSAGKFVLSRRRQKQNGNIGGGAVPPCGIPASAAPTPSGERSTYLQLPAYLARYSVNTNLLHALDVAQAAGANLQGQESVVSCLAKRGETLLPAFLIHRHSKDEYALLLALWCFRLRAPVTSVSPDGNSPMYGEINDC